MAASSGNNGRGVDIMDSISEKDSAAEIMENLDMWGPHTAHLVHDRGVARSHPAIAYVEGHAPTGFGLMMGARPRFEADDLKDRISRLRDEFKGVNAGKSGHGDFPRVSKDDFDQIVYMGTIPDDDTILDVILAKFCKPGSKEWHDYLATRVGKRVPRPDGKGEYSVVRAMAPRGVPMADVRYASTSTEKKRKYALSQVFSDGSVREKYGIPLKLIHDTEMLALTRPVDAAAVLEQFMQSQVPQGVTVKVTAASYSLGAAQAAHVITTMAKRFGIVEVYADLIGNTLFVYNLDKTWHVQGPLRYGNVVKDVFVMCQKVGIHETIHLYALETQKLGIDAYVGNNCVSPKITGHAKEPGSPAMESTMKQPLDAENQSRFDRLKKNVMPLYSEPGGYHIATSVRLEPRGVLVNEHVMQLSDRAEVDGRELKTGMPVANDVWAYECPGEFEPWVFSEPKKGLRAAIMFHDGREVVLSPPFLVDSCDGPRIMSQSNGQIGRGMSGGAIVSLTDMSMLGIHVGDTLHYLVGASITSTTYQDLIDAMDELSGNVADSRINSGSILDGFKQRGLHRQFLATVNAVSPLYLKGEHVGSAIQADDNVVVAVAPEGTYDVGSNDLAFEQKGIMTIASAKVTTPVPLRREPERFERVVVVGKDAEGSYVSEIGKVCQVGAAGKTFMVAGLGSGHYPLAGGIVVSVNDCAVLGMCVRKHSSVELGSASLCVRLPESGTTDTGVKEYLIRLFPFMYPGLWPDDCLDRVFTHSSLTQGDPDACNLGLAKLGDAYVRLRLLESLRAGGVSAGEWQGYQTHLLSNNNMAKVCHNLGLDTFLRKAKGVSLPTGSKAYADLIEALVALVHQNENGDVVGEFLSVLGLVPMPAEFVGSEREYGRMMARPDEISIGAANRRLSPAGEMDLG